MKGIKNTFRIKVGDKVQVIAGDDKGKVGKVTQVLAQDALVVVEGVNQRVKHLKSSRKDEKGHQRGTNRTGGAKGFFFATFFSISCDYH